MIRPALAIDAPFLAWAMLTASRSHLETGPLDWLLPGPEALRLLVLKKFVLAPFDHVGHYSRFLVADVDGQPAAALGTFDPADIRAGANLTALIRALAIVGSAAAEIDRMLERLTTLESLDYVEPDGVLVLEWVAALPSRRRRGLVRALVQAAMTSGKKSGLPRAQVGVRAGNRAAMRLYESLGFQVVARHHSPEYFDAIGTWGMERMQAAL